MRYWNKSLQEKTALCLYSRTRLKGTCIKESPLLRGHIFESLKSQISVNLKAPYSSKIDILLSKKGLIKIYGINTNIKCGT